MLSPTPKWNISKRKQKRNYSDTQLGKIFTAITLKAWSIKEKIDKLDLIKIKTSAILFFTVGKLKR